MPQPETCDLLCLDAVKAERVRDVLPSAPVLEASAQAAQAFSDPTRLRVALALREGVTLCVCDLGFIVARDEKLVSHHLRTLKAAGLASSRREGRMVMYELTPDGRRLLAAVMAPAMAEASA